MSDPTLTDFLNATFQTTNDIGRSRVNGLVNDKERHQEQLDRTLLETKESTQAMLKELLAKSTAQKNDLDSLHTSLEDTKQALDTCAGAATSTHAPLLDQLGTLAQKLTTLDHAKQYLKALLVASDLEEKTTSLVKSDPAQAIDPYQQLVRLAASIRSCIYDATAEAQFQGLMSHLDYTSNKLYQELFNVMSSNFRNSLEKLQWPSPIKPPFGPQVKSKIDDFEAAFQNLLLLKRPEDMDKPFDPQTMSLLPINIMLEALSMRFKFHFESSKPTNRLDKPEWYLSHTKSTIASHVPLLLSTIQPIIERNLSSSVSAKDCFIRGLVENVARKLRTTVPKMTNKPHLMSHTIHQVLDFDNALSKDFAYYPYEGGAMGDVILGNEKWFTAWFDAERKFAQKRYDEIAVDSQAFEPYAEEDERESKRTNDTVKSTKSSAKLIHLFESITDTYKLIPSVEKKLRFFMGIQMWLLNQYHGRLLSALDAFEALSLMRSVPVPGGLPESVTGVITSAETGGSIAALRRLCRWWASARVIGDTLRELADDDFFLTLQFELRDNVDLAVQVTNELKALDSGLAFLDGVEAADKSLFAQPLEAFQHLTERAENLMTRIIMKEWAADARMYVRRWQMLENGDNDDDQDHELSSELYQPLQNFRLSCHFLASNLPTTEFIMVYRRLSVEIEDWHMRNIIAPNRLTQVALKTLANDLEQGLWSVGRQWVTKPENYMRK
ncbi:hypothetical protein O0I10_000993 [Lichtheimia ornata]|uniref:Rint-1 family protein n=1 Tax=Lichtheimia ornata TaxID=688661 RepID=A0AAD7Y2Y3_9FUNG|nr:uncharacterized protein O0I10_000993 [Lichtheimia ornata]KAJ8662817.1 hypothetical protein O0I10_000993 [Lichtheimia ornata]